MIPVCRYAITAIIIGVLIELSTGKVGRFLASHNNLNWSLRSQGIVLTESVFRGFLCLVGIAWILRHRLRGFIRPRRTCHPLVSGYRSPRMRLPKVYRDIDCEDDVKDLDYIPVEEETEEVEPFWTD